MISPANFERLADLPIGESISGCFYGGAGDGKTAMMMTAGDRTLYCAPEGRLSTLQNPKMQRLYPFNPIIITVTESPHPEGGAKALSELTDKIKLAIKYRSNDFDIIIVDGTTAVRRFAMNMALEISGLGSNASTGGSDRGSKIKSIVKGFPYAEIGMREYGMEMRMIESFIISMKEYCMEDNKHFFMTAHERLTYNKPAKLGDEPTLNSTRPGFTGQTFPDDIPGLFDLVWHLESKGGADRTTYWARTSGDEKTVAKSCLGSFPNMIQNPNIQDIIRNVRGESIANTR